MLCSSGLIFCGRAIDCRGFVPGTPKLLVRKAGPASDNREVDEGAGLWTVDGSGILDRIFNDGSWIGCITERRRSMSCRARGALTVLEQQLAFYKSRVRDLQFELFLAHIQLAVPSPTSS